MATLTSKIQGVHLWAYDIARRPDKTPDSNGNPQTLRYTKVNTQGDTVSPATQTPTEGLAQAVNRVMFVSDVNNTFTGNGMLAHGIKSTPGNNNDLEFKTITDNSAVTYSNLMFDGDDVYIHANALITRDIEKTAFTTTTPGIRIIDQTGVVQSSQGYALVIFEVSTGYKIPVGATIKANPTVQNAGGTSVAGTPETYPVIYDMQPGIYSVILTADKNNNWLNCDIDFATVQDTVTPTTTPTTTTTTPTATTSTPTVAPTPTTTTTKPTTPTNTTVTTQLDTLKNSLRIPSDLTNDDKLLQSYLDGATEYLKSTIDSDEDVVAKLNSKRAQVVINALAELMYENRGSDKVVTGFPYTLQVLINQLRFA